MEGDSAAIRQGPVHGAQYRLPRGFYHRYRLFFISLISFWLQGGGLLWDLEFLNDASGRRVAAFGKTSVLSRLAKTEIILKCLGG